MSEEPVIKPLIAIIGRPNVGKSTLFNRIIGKREALVRDEPGITRDRRYGEGDWDGVSFRLLDTGGLEFQTKTALQKKVTQQALTGIKEADILILLMDGRAGVTALDREWVDEVRKLDKPKFFVINKIDSAKDEALLTQFYELGLEDFIPVSSETGRRVGELLDLIVERLINPPHPPLNLRGGEGGVIHPFKIAIIGRPNVGKSTLLNTLLGDERAIVDEAPGTTRDPVDTYLAFQNIPLCLVDTAGIRKRGRTKEVIEKFSVIKSLQTLDNADMAFLLLDGIEGITDQDAHVAGEAVKRGKALVLLVNKWDQGEKKGTKEGFKESLDRQMRFIDSTPLLFISAQTGRGTSSLFRLALELKPEYEFQADPEELAETLRGLVEEHPLPVFRGRNIEIGGVRQGGIKPPTFLVFCSQPDKIHFSYKRYLTNGIKERFNLQRVPVRVVFKRQR